MRGGKLYLYVKGITREKGALYRVNAYGKVPAHFQGIAKCL